MLIKSNEFDQIFFIFSRMNSNMHKKLQHKTKTIIDLKNAKWNNELYMYDDNRTMILMKPLLRNEEQKEKARKLIETIRNFCINQLYENIAINVEFGDAPSYFEFKMLLKKILCGSRIEVTIYLNKVIEVTDPSLIQKILKQYHDSLLVGHNSLEIMKNTIRKFFEWHNMTTDIKNYVKNCGVCERQKITRHNKNPMQITSTASRPFEKVYIDLVGRT